MPVERGTLWEDQGTFTFCVWHFCNNIILRINNCFYKQQTLIEAQTCLRPHTMSVLQNIDEGFWGSVMSHSQGNCRRQASGAWSCPFDRNHKAVTCGGFSAHKYKFGRITSVVWPNYQTLYSQLFFWFFKLSHKDFRVNAGFATFLEWGWRCRQEGGVLAERGSILQGRPWSAEICQRCIRKALLFLIFVETTHMPLMSQI